MLFFIIKGLWIFKKASNRLINYICEPSLTGVCTYPSRFTLGYQDFIAYLTSYECYLTIIIFYILACIIAAILIKLQK